MYYAFMCLGLAVVVWFMYGKLNAGQFLEKAKEYYREGRYLKALKQYKKYAIFGNVNVDDRLAKFYLDGLGVDKDIDKAMGYLERGGKRGNADCFAEMAVTFGLDDPEKADMYWEKYFDSHTFNKENLHIPFDLDTTNPVYKKVFYICSYLQAVAYEALPLKHYHRIQNYKKEVLKLHESAIDYFIKNDNRPAADRRQFELDYCRSLFAKNT